MQELKTITQLQETKRGRISLFIDGEFDFSVDKETFLKENLCVGKKLTQSAYEILKDETQYQKAKEKAFALLSERSYPRKTLEDKLLTDFTEDCVEQVLCRLEELGLIDDIDYAKRSARDMVHLKHFALSRIRCELRKKGIGENDIEDALEEFDSEEETERLTELLRTKYYRELLNEQGKKKVFSALLRLGYEAEEIRRQIDFVCSEIPEEEKQDPAEEIRALLLKKYASGLTDPKGVDRAVRGLMRKGFSYQDIKQEIELLQEELEDR